MDKWLEKQPKEHHSTYKMKVDSEQKKMLEEAAKGEGACVPADKTEVAMEYFNK